MLYAVPFALLRVPLQSLEKAYDFSDMNEPLFSQGIYLSSPELWNEYEKLATLSDKEKQKLLLSISKYKIRSCTRCTPFGTFAGTAIASITDAETKLVVNNSNNHKRHLRLDMNFMSELIKGLHAMPHIKKQVKFFLNNSLYEYNDEYRYAEYTIENNARIYRLTSVEKNKYLEKILAHAESGINIQECAKLLQDDDLEKEEIEIYINELIDSQILISELEPAITGREPLEKLTEQLTSFKNSEDLIARLASIRLNLKQPQKSIAYYQSAEKEIRKLNLSDQNFKTVLQEDLFLSMKDFSLSKDLINSITDEANELLILSKPVQNKEFEDFKNKFSSKYDAAEIPVVIALDADAGIGYSGVYGDSTGNSEWINDIHTDQKDNNEALEINQLQKFALVKYHDWLKEKKDCIEITKEELKLFEKKSFSHIFPSGMYLMGSLFKQSGKLNKNDFVFDIAAFGGTSSANLLSRFTPGNTELEKLAKEIIAEEEKENADAIYAEIVHLPEAKIGNILLRPLLRNYEIPYAGKSGADESKQIPVTDLMISIVSNKIILRSKKLNKEIIPRLTSAHNFSYKSLPVYKFLCDMQAQDYNGTNIWDWGNLNSLKHLPGVIYKNLVIKKAQWKIEEKDIENFPAEFAEQQKFIQHLRIKYQIPSRIVYAENDNELLLDLNEKTGIELLVHFIKRHKKILLEEFLFTKENCVVKDECGSSFTNEIVIPLYQNAEIKKATQRKLNGQKKIKRKFSPASEWLYFKIYCGPKTAEKLLRTNITSFINEGFNNLDFDKFFFIRYKDEAPHLRIRFYNEDKNKQFYLQKKFSEILQPLLDNNVIDKISVDTYSRELERYGENTMEDSENLFCNDSFATLGILPLLEERDDPKYRLLLSLRSIDMFMNDFHFSTEEKYSIIKQMQAAYFNEFSGGKNLQKQLNDKYRKYAPLIRSYLNESDDEKNETEEAIHILKARSEKNILSVKNILSQQENDITLQELLQSHIHMIINRIFISNQRKYELVIYHFLERYFYSQIAADKKK